MDNYVHLVIGYTRKVVDTLALLFFQQGLDLQSHMYQESELAKVVLSFSSKVVVD